MYLTQALHRSARQAPDMPATIFGDRVRTWARSADRVARLAAGLRGVGVRDGDRVAMLALNSDRYHEYLFAVPWAGAVLTPINVRWTPAEIVYALGDSGSAVLLVDDTFAPILPSLRGLCRGLRTVIHCGDDPTPEGTLSFEVLIAGHEPAPDAHRSGDDLAGIFYTGGTIAHPKGVCSATPTCWSRRWAAVPRAAGSSSRTGGSCTRPRCPIQAAIAAWMGRGVAGGTHVVVPMFTPAAVVETIERHAVTEVLLVPTMIQMLVAHLEDHPADLSGVRHLIYGASPISEAAGDAPRRGRLRRHRGARRRVGRAGARRRGAGPRRLRHHRRAAGALHRRMAAYKAPRSVDVVDALPVSPRGRSSSASCAPYWASTDRAVH